MPKQSVKQQLLLLVNSSKCFWQTLHRFKLMFSFRSTPLEAFIKKDVLKRFAKCTGKHLCRSLVLIKLQAWGLQIFWKRIRHRCFPVHFAETLKTRSSTEYLRKLLLVVIYLHWTLTDWFFCDGNIGHLWVNNIRLSFLLGNIRFFFFYLMSIFTIS